MVLLLALVATSAEIPTALVVVVGAREDLILAGTKRIAVIHRVGGMGHRIPKADRLILGTRAAIGLSRRKGLGDTEAAVDPVAGAASASDAESNIQGDALGLAGGAAIIVTGQVFRHLLVVITLSRVAVAVECGLGRGFGGVRDGRGHDGGGRSRQEKSNGRVLHREY